MKILVINGSPRGEYSNTMALTHAFLEGAGWPEAEILCAAGAEVKGCLGCFRCWSETPGQCVIEDDMAFVLPKLIAADVIIWSFPLYYYSVPGQLKNLIDRQLPLSLPGMAEGTQSGDHSFRYDLSHQRHVVISTCGYWTPEGNYTSITAMFDRIFGDSGYTSLFCGQGGLFPLANMDAVPGLEELKQRVEEYLETVQRAGREFVGGKLSAQTKAKLAAPLLPQDVYEQASNAAFG
ncbi:MAG: flavodoxin family protein [Oscillospiraceae bacterium]|nr:flavodoxin family protein [Oscillospiraceae bacterium]